MRDFFIWKWYEFCVIILHIGHFHSYFLSTELVGFLTVFLRCCVLLLCFIQLRCLRDVLFFFFGTVLRRELFYLFLRGVA